MGAEVEATESEDRVKRTTEMDAPDWPKLIDDLAAVMSIKQVANAMGLDSLTDGMLRSYRDGVQPTYWRGAALVKFWCDTLGKKQAEVPVAPVVRGHRVARRTQAELQRITVPVWPVAVPQGAGILAKKQRKQRKAVVA